MNLFKLSFCSSRYQPKKNGETASISVTYLFLNLVEGIIMIHFTSMFLFFLNEKLFIFNTFTFKKIQNALKVNINIYYGNTYLIVRVLYLRFQKYLLSNHILFLTDFIARDNHHHTRIKENLINSISKRQKSNFI